MSYNVFQSLSKTGGMFFHHEKMQPFSLTVDIKLFLETICICNSFEYTSYVFQKQSGFLQITLHLTLGFAIPLFH